MKIGTIIRWDDGTTIVWARDGPKQYSLDETKECNREIARVEELLKELGE